MSYEWEASKEISDSVASAIHEFLGFNIQKQQLDLQKQQLQFEIKKQLGFDIPETTPAKPEIPGTAAQQKWEAISPQGTRELKAGERMKAGEQMKTTEISPAIPATPATPETTTMRHIPGEIEKTRAKEGLDAFNKMIDTMGSYAKAANVQANPAVILALATYAQKRIDPTAKLPDEMANAFSQKTNLPPEIFKEFTDLFATGAEPDRIVLSLIAAHPEVNAEQIKQVFSLPFSKLDLNKMGGGRPATQGQKMSQAARDETNARNTVLGKKRYDASGNFLGTDKGLKDLDTPEMLKQYRAAIESASPGEKNLINAQMAELFPDMFGKNKGLKKGIEEKVNAPDPMLTDLTKINSDAGKKADSRKARLDWIKGKYPDKKWKMDMKGNITEFK